jgi:RNA polymerase sigma-B factor
VTASPDLVEHSTTEVIGGRTEYDHLAPLLAEYALLAADDPRRAELRGRLVQGFLPVVQHIALRYRNRGEPLDDLEQVGAIGLIGALERFEPGRGASFLSFAVPTISGEIRRHFRDRTWAVRVSRGLKDMQGPLRASVGELSNELGRAPRPSEIATRMGIGVEEVIEGLRAQDAYQAGSLDAPVNAGGGTVGESLGGVDSALEAVDTNNVLRLLLDRLPARERRIVVLRFFGGLTQTQIAAEVGLSQMHVSRLLARSLRQLRGGLEAD